MQAVYRTVCLLKTSLGLNNEDFRHDQRDTLVQVHVGGSTTHHDKGTVVCGVPVLTNMQAADSTPCREGHDGDSMKRLLSVVACLMVGLTACAYGVCLALYDLATGRGRSI